MKNSRKILSLILIFTLVVSFFLWEYPVKSEAATSFDTTLGTFVINTLQNDFTDGKYLIRYNFEYNNVPMSFYSINLKNVRLENSSGKKVATWKDSEVLKGGGTLNKNYQVDFSALPSDTYYFRFTVEPSYAPSKAQSFQRKIVHNAGTITYSKANYSTDTLGNRSLYVYFNIKMLNGKSPKLEIYNSNNKLVYSITTKKTISGNNCNWYWKWDMTNSSNGLPVSPGAYSFKVTCGGKSCVKKLNIN